MLPKLILMLAVPLLSYAAEFDCMDLPLGPLLEYTYSQTPTADFEFRDGLPQTEVNKSQWETCCGSYGPCPLPFPGVVFPAGASQKEWLRARVIQVAKKYIGVSYKHHHIPKMGGLDCSNFTSWVYNYGFGIRISSRVKRQAFEAGRLLSSNEPLISGDLIFFWNKDGNEISHAAIYIDQQHIIDSTGIGVLVRPFMGWYKERFAWARRIID